MVNELGNIEQILITSSIVCLQWYSFFGMHCFNPLYSNGDLCYFRVLPEIALKTDVLGLSKSELIAYSKIPI